MFYLCSAPVARPQSHFPQHTGGLAGGSSHHGIHQRLLQRRPAQPVSAILNGKNIPEKDPSSQSFFFLTWFLCPCFSLQMSGEDHRRPDDVVPCGHHADLHGQPQRPGAQLPTGQHLQDRPLPAKSKAALQVSWAVLAVFVGRHVSFFKMSTSCTHWRHVCVCVCAQWSIPEWPRHQRLLVQHAGAAALPAERGWSQPSGLVLQRWTAQVSGRSLEAASIITIIIKSSA